MGKPKIYLDICSYNRPFDNQSQMKIRLETEAKLYVQTGIREKIYSMVWSYMHDYENNDNPYDERRNTIAPWKNIADYYCPSSNTIPIVGNKIMQLGIKPKDALHLACAIESGCDYFITTDKGLTNKNVSNIKIINPIDFVREMEDL
ncbi:MAG: hypothetical protein LBD23_03450 [Oscillospiraceae bacterium]|jgi:hypothetical protein|nr:hypothetical protein [Oscillospiraceae bacterium]